MDKNVQYEVALSFAGEQREYVEEVARSLQSREVSIFYDGFANVALWGKNLVEEFQNVFENRANYIVMFISKAYVEETWPTYERQSILSRAVQNKGKYILPVRFDDTLVPGLPTATKYEKACDHTPAELAAMIATKLGIKRFESKASDVSPPRMTSLTGEVVFDYSSHNGHYIIGRGELEFETKWSKASNVSIYIYNDPPSINGVALAQGCASIAQVLNAEALDYTSRTRTPQCGEVIVLRNVNGFYVAVHVLEIKNDTRGDDKDELRFQYAIQADNLVDFTKFSEE